MQTLIYDVTVTDTLGQTFPLSDCTLLCAVMGELDYSDPIAVIYPDGETVIHSGDLLLHNSDGESLTLEDVTF